MHIFLWVLQVVLALHTAMGGIWKFSASEQTVPSLRAIPHPVWLGMAVFELLLAVCLLLPAVVNPPANLVPIAAACIAAEMLVFCALHLTSGVSQHGQPVYWLVVALICAGLAYGRGVVRPF